jgi:hypothetical protein
MHLAQQNYFLHPKEKLVKKANKTKQNITIIFIIFIHFQLPPPVTNFYHRKQTSVAVFRHRRTQQHCRSPPENGVCA